MELFVEVREARLLMSSVVGLLRTYGRRCDDVPFARSLAGTEALASRQLGGPKLRLCAHEVAPLRHSSLLDLFGFDEEAITWTLKAVNP